LLVNDIDQAAVDLDGIGQIQPGVHCASGVFADHPPPGKAASRDTPNGVAFLRQAGHGRLAGDGAIGGDNNLHRCGLRSNLRWRYGRDSK
jgi:hypothetical protein